jgi:hypothetical protein
MPSKIHVRQWDWEVKSVHDRLYDRIVATKRGVCALQVSEFRAVEALAGGAVIQEMPVHISELFLAPS